MNLEEFFKTTSMKIRLSIASFLIIFIIYFLYLYSTTICVHGNTGEISYSSCGRGSTTPPLIFLILSYPLSCLLIFIYNKIKNEKTKRFIGFFFTLAMLYLILIFLLLIVQVSDNLIYFTHGIFIFALLFYILIKMLGKRR